MKQLTAKQINKQLQTWRKNAPEMYAQIMTRARQEKALTPSGNITSKKEGEFFRNWYSQYKGSFTDTLKKTMNTEKVNKENAKKLIQLQSRKSEIITMLYATLGSDQAYRIVKLADDTAKSEDGSLAQINTFLNEVDAYLNKGKAIDIDKFNEIMEEERGVIIE